MDDEIGDFVACLGVIGAQTDVVKRALAVNAAKAALKALFAPLQRVRIRVPVKGSATKAIPALRVMLRHIQRSDLNVHAAFRKIPILKVPPATVTYTRANTPRRVSQDGRPDCRHALQRLTTCGHCTANASPRSIAAPLISRGSATLREHPRQHPLRPLRPERPRPHPDLRRAPHHLCHRPPHPEARSQFPKRRRAATDTHSQINSGIGALSSLPSGVSLPG
jgi:hypothetical protein